MKEEGPAMSKGWPKDFVTFFVDKNTNSWDTQYPFASGKQFFRFFFARPGIQFCIPKAFRPTSHCLRIIIFS